MWRGKGGGAEAAGQGQRSDNGGEDKANLHDLERLLSALIVDSSARHLVKEIKTLRCLHGHERLDLALLHNVVRVRP